MTSRISCDAHDYFEIVCMRRSQILASTYDNQYYGVALGLNVINGEEFIFIKKDDVVSSVKLTNIIELKSINDKVAHHNFSVQWP